MRKILLASTLVTSLALAGCVPDGFAQLIKSYCNIEPSIDDLARVQFPAFAITEDMLHAAAIAFCKLARAQASTASTAAPGARRPGGVVSFRDGTGRTQRVHYSGVPQ